MTRTLFFVAAILFAIGCAIEPVDLRRSSGRRPVRMTASAPATTSSPTAAGGSSRTTGMAGGAVTCSSTAKWIRTDGKDTVRPKDR